MLTQKEFESRLVEIIQSVPGLEGAQPDFVGTINPVCRANYYKVGMGLPGAVLLEIRDKVMMMLSSSGCPVLPRTVSFEIEGDVLSPHYGKTYVNIRHLHFSRQASMEPFAISSKGFAGTDLVVSQVFEKDKVKSVTFTPPWPGEKPFGMTMRLLHAILDKDGHILINHQKCTHERIDGLVVGDVVTVPMDNKPR